MELKECFHDLRDMIVIVNDPRETGNYAFRVLHKSRIC